MLIVDDEPRSVEIVFNRLRSEHFDVNFAGTSPEAVARLKGERFDVAIIDALMNPGLSAAFATAFPELARELNLDIDNEAHQGFAVADWIRQNQPDVGIIMLTGNYYTKNEMVFGLEVGADDYLDKKNLDIEVFCSRVRALVRRCRPFDSERVSVKEFDLYFKPQKVVSKNGGVAYLTDAEFLVLKLLYMNRNAVVSRDQIIAYVTSENDTKHGRRSADTLVSTHIPQVIR